MASPSPKTGQTLGRYRILDKIGAGGMGEVYRARDEQLERDVAIKVLPASGFSDPEARRRLLREARSAAALNHPNVCTIHEVGEADGQVFIAMELIEGQRLDRLIPPGGLPVAEVLRHGLQIADAVAHAHQRGIVHRDLKTSNTLVTQEGRAKVLDFGLAKRVGGDALTGAVTESVPLTDTGAVVGTVAYMSPELLSGQPADTRSDVWALGVVFFEMAAGTRPFQGRTGFELSSAILNQPPAALPGKVPVELRLVIERCLEKAPERRYQRAGELHAALQAVETGSARAPRWRSRRSGRGVALAALLLATLAAAFALDVGRARSRWLSRTAAPPGTIKLAVLPFQNLTGDSGQEYLSDGITEEMIAQLGRLNPQRLGVIARTSAMRYKKMDKPIDQIGRELSVDYILEGSTRREGTRVKINAQLIQVRDQTQRWADSYERELSGILALQSEVAQGVARSLAVALLPEQQARAATARAVNPRAFEEYLKGRFQMAKRTAASLEAAAAHFERAIALDADYALGHAGLADVRVLLPFFTGRQYGPALARAESAAARALELDPSLAQAHTALALVKEYSFAWEPAEAHFRRALELDPGYATAHHWYADLLARRGRSTEALAEIRRALELDPLSPIINQDLGYVLSWAGDREAAIRQYRRTVELNPDFGTTWSVLASALLVEGRFDEAAHAFERWAELTGRDKAAVGRLVQAVAAYARSGVPQPLPTEVNPYLSASIHMLLGNDRRALEILEQAYADGVFSVVMSMGSPAFDRIRSEPRFVALWSKAGLPPLPERR